MVVQRIRLFVSRSTAALGAVRARMEHALRGRPGIAAWFRQHYSGAERDVREIVVRLRVEQLHEEWGILRSLANAYAYAHPTMVVMEEDLLHYDWVKTQTAAIVRAMREARDERAAIEAMFVPEEQELEMEEE